MRFGFFDQLPRADWQSERQRGDIYLADVLGKSITKYIRKR